MKSRPQSAASSVEKLFQQVDDHVRPGSGLSNEIVESFCRLRSSKDFVGVYSADYIPDKLAARGTFILAVNLGKRRGERKKLPVGHFVVISARPSMLYYLDPYGMPCMQENVQRFLRLCRRPVEYNLKQIQHLDSAYCGLYAVLFVLCFDKASGGRDTFKWKRKRIIENDQLCVRYLRKILSRK